MTDPGAAGAAQVPPALRVGVALAALWAVIALSMQLFRVRAFGRRPFFSSPAGDPRRGVAYAFGPGMLPSAKESVRTNLAAWAIGIAFHLGAFAGFLALVLAALGTPPEGIARPVLQACCLMGTVAGVALLARRLLDRVLRGLSSPDDYLANLLTTAFAALAFAATARSAARPWFLAAAALLLLYLPVGKIRHCVFFFPTRYHAAFFFGRRGAYPPHA